MAKDGAMVSLLAAVEAASASAPQPSTSSANPVPPLNPPRLAPIRSLRTSQRSAHRFSSAVPPPPPLPPPLPSPPPLPPISVRRRPPSQSKNDQSDSQGLVTVHEASPPVDSFAAKRKGARIFTADEKKVLEANYSRNKFPSRLHMQTLGRAMGKGTEKVRTWYNNRRALDRKLGVDVSRNQAEDTASSSTSTPFTARHLEEEPVILPRCVIASPMTDTSPGKQTVTPTEGGMVNVTPSAISWAPAMSPVSDKRGFAETTAANSQRFRMSPLRIRNGRLVIGEVEIRGEGERGGDDGLEVKFLFGKKRVVYEWYCGDNFADAKETGGPYAKMEMTFDSVEDVQLFRSGDRSVLQLSFAAKPTLYVQTQESMDKYKARAQQRQYRKVGQDDFPLSVSSGIHRIWMRADEAIRISKILVEDSPRLEAEFQTWSPGPSQGAKREERAVATTPSARRENYTHLSSPSLPMGVTNHSCLKSPRPPVGLPVQSEPTVEVCGAQSNRQLPGASHVNGLSPAAMFADARHVQPMIGNDAPLVRATTAAGAGTNLLATPAPWQSPATPFVSTARPRRTDSSLQWLPTGVPSSVKATPVTARTGLEATTPRTVHTVRRELNFGGIHRSSLEAGTPSSAGRKRKSHYAGIGDENERRSPARRRIDPDGSRTPLQAMQAPILEPPLPPQLPPSLDMAIADMRSRDLSRTSNQQPGEKIAGMLQRLPR